MTLDEFNKKYGEGSPCYPAHKSSALLGEVIKDYVSHVLPRWTPKDISNMIIGPGSSSGIYDDYYRNELRIEFETVESKLRSILNNFKIVFEKE